MDSKIYSPWQTVLRLFRYSKAYYHWYLGLIIVNVFNSAANILMVEGSRRMINGASEADINLVYSGLFLALLFLISTVILDFIDQYLGFVLDYSSTMKFSLLFIDKLSKITLLKIRKYHSGKLINRNEEVADVQSGINSAVRSFLQNLSIIIFMFFYLYKLNARLSLFIIITSILVFPVVSIIIAIPLRSYYDKCYQARDIKNSFLQDLVQGAEIIRTFSLGTKIKDKFCSLYEKMLFYIKRALIYKNIAAFSHQIVNLILLLFILVYGGRLVIEGALDIGALVAFLVSYDAIIKPLEELSKAWPEFQKSASKANRIFTILDLEEEEVKDNIKEKDIKKENTIPEVEFKCISFSFYEKKVLKNISFSVESGKMTAIVGPSGSGKSTLLKILLRFYKIDSGEILYNGFPLELVPIMDLRNIIGYVSQEPCLFSGTIYENILQGKPNAKEIEVINAAKQANIHEYILGITNGYKTKIGEKGMNLSGGEKQRIAIARAILKNPSILVLDEPTSSLDNENEYVIKEALDNLMLGRTTIIVTHRLHTIINANTIIYLEDGIIKEMGNHKELLNSKGKYYEMFYSINEGVVSNGFA